MAEHRAGAQTGCGISVLGDVQDPAGCAPEQPDLIRPVLSRELD